MRHPSQFRILGEAGAGGFSIVYHVEDVDSKRRYALKKVASADPRWTWPR